MEVNSSEWKSKAIENITKYLHRGGQFAGDVPQLIGGSDLLNTIGMAMGLPMSNPETWTEYELERAMNGELVFFENEAREAIDAVAEQIRSCCGRVDRYFVTVLPVELYYEGKLYELPIFRVQRYKNSKIYYVDNVGRYYGSFSNWFDFNILPPGDMAYPCQLKLSRFPNSNEAHVKTALTPCARIDAKAARGLDTVAAVAGLGSSVALLFVTGGLAAPLLGTAIATAGWGTTRAGYQLIEKAAHGENVNPFTNSKSRMLWLGIAANLTSFGAMGASMRLTSLAARGREISTALQVVADIANGANIAVSGLAIFNTTIFMIQNYEDLSAVDILMHGASIAFWTKGVYSYKTANTIIKEAQSRAFTHINQQLSQEEANELAALRDRVQNDRKLLQRYHAAMSSNIPVRTYTQFLLDGIHYYDTVANLSPEQIEAFYSIRNFVKDDFNLIAGLRSISSQYNLSPTETVERVINMWQQMSTSNMPSGTNAMLKEGNLILGTGPPIKIANLPKLSPPLIRFLGEHLSRLDVVISRQWYSSVDTLINLQSKGMFSCVITRLVTDSGRAVIVLNGQLEISIYKLHSINEDNCKKLFHMISQLSPNDTSSNLSPELVQLCVRELRLRLECHRLESVQQTLRYVGNHKSLQQLLLQADLKSFEKDRLYTFVGKVDLYKAENYLSGMMNFAAEMGPLSVNELVAYCEFVMTCVENEATSLKCRIKRKEVTAPANTKISIWTRQKAAAKVFEDMNLLKQKFENISQIVERNDMIGAVSVESSLSDEQLVAAVRRVRVRFGSRASAAYHVLKCPTTPLDAFVTRANDTLRAPVAACVSAGQAGDVRTLEVRAPSGRVLALERGGRVVLCTFMPAPDS